MKDSAPTQADPATPQGGSSNRVPTPITDAEVFIRCDQYTMWAEQECVEADVARKLERDRARLVEALKGWRESYVHNEYEGGREGRATLTKQLLIELGEL